MTVDQFVERIGRWGREIDQIQMTALEVAGPLVAQMKAAAPVDSGDLRNSIGIAVEGDARAIYLTMLSYGYFQNYGVEASPSSNTAKNFGQAPVEEQVRFALPPSGGDKFRFGTKVEGTKPWGAFYSGLNAVGFFSMAEIERVIVEGIGPGITQRINNI